MAAVISDCGNYRYTLHRGDAFNALVFLMLNPSTADASTDDRTIGRCREFVKKYGYTGLIVVNLYAYRSTDPKALKLVPDPVGPDNDRYLEFICKGADVVCAWGNNADKDRVKVVVDILKLVGANMMCLDTNKSGMPKHPLYISGDQKLVKWNGL